jgi:hypothetical protein
MPSDIFWYPAIWLAAAAGSFYDILTVVQKSYFFAKNGGVKTIFKLKTPPKKFKNPPYPYKDSKMQWIGFSGLSAKLEMYFSPTKLRKKQI